MDSNKDGQRQKEMMTESVIWDTKIRRHCVDLMKDPFNPMTLEDVKALLEKRPDKYASLEPLLNPEIRRRG